MTACLKPGETWSEPNQQCVKFECEIIEGQFNPTEIRRACPIEDCPQGTKYEKTEGECCGKCVQVACIMKLKDNATKILQPGETWSQPNQPCVKYECEIIEGQFNPTEVRRTCSIEDCPLGTKYEKAEGECCGQCVPWIPLACVIKLKDNATQVLQPDETWNPPNQPCIKYECHIIEDQYIPVEVRRACPVEDCPVGYEYETTPGECCGHCVKVACVMTLSDNSTQILKAGEVYTPPEDNCTSYKCTSTLEIVGGTKPCPVFNPEDCLQGTKYEKAEEECCGKCVQVACVMKLKDNTTKILQLGETWSPPDQVCVKYECDIIEDQYIPVEIRKTCPVEDCPVGTKYVEPEDKCLCFCGPVACVIKLKDNTTKLVQPGETWSPSDQPCATYECGIIEGQYIPVEIRRVCPVEDCPVGYEYETMPGECCGHCIKVACVMTLLDNSTQILKPGEVYTPPEDKCTTYKCTSILEIVGGTKPCPAFNPEDCPQSTVFEKAEGECCGQCVPKVPLACVIKLKDNTSQTVQPGETWSPPDQPCVKYECDVIEGQLISVEIRRACPIEDCSVGYKYETTPGECCGHCVKIACVMTLSDNTTKILKPTEVYVPPEDQCASYECTSTFEIVGVTKTCPAFNPNDCLEGTIRSTEDGCCKTCDSALSGCQVHKQSRQIKSGTCESDQVVELSFCGGGCMTSSMYSTKSSTMEHKCSCCQEVKTSKREVNLECLDGTSTVYTYLYAEECSCATTECDNGTQTSISQEEQQTVNQEQKHKKIK